jgi:hypothetical protein
MDNHQMKPTKTIVTTALFLLLSAALLGCATPTKPLQERPQWTMHGDGLFIGPGRVLYGVGIAPAVKKKGLSHRTASNRARAVLGSFVADFGKTMLNTRKQDERKHTMMRSAEEHDGQMYVDMKRACKRALYRSGMRAVALWADPNDGTFYALARVEFDTFLDTLLKDHLYSRRDHAYFARNADRVFNKVAGNRAKGYVEGDWP